jgi:hypothetical protein
VSKWKVTRIEAKGGNDLGSDGEHQLLGSGGPEIVHGLGQALFGEFLDGEAGIAHDGRHIITLESLADAVEIVIANEDGGEHDSNAIAGGNLRSRIVAHDGIDDVEQFDTTENIHKEREMMKSQWLRQLWYHRSDDSAAGSQVT